jgi:signal transduction histidine kinase
MNIASAAAAHDTDEMIVKIDGLNEEAWRIRVTEPARALVLSIEAKKISEDCGYRKGLAYALRNMGVSQRYLSNLETALSLTIQALNMFAQMGEKIAEAQAYGSMGSIYYYMGDLERSLDHFLKAIRYGEESADKESMAYGYNGAGYIYGVHGDYKKGLEFLQKAFMASKELESSYDLHLSILDSLAVAYSNNGQMDQAYDAYSECLRISERSFDKVNIGYALFGIGDLFEKQKRFEEARQYFLKSLIVRREAGYKVGEATSLLHLGKLSLDHDPDAAKDYLQQSLAVAEGIKAKAVIYEAHEALAQLYERKGDIRSFAEHYKLFHKYKSEVFTEEQESKQKYLTIQYEMEKLQKETEINRLTNVVMKEKNEELEKKTEQLEQSYNNISVLSRIGKDITSTLDLDTILNTVYENVNQLMDATIFGIGIYKAEEASIEYRLAIEKGKRYQPYRRSMNDKRQLAVWCIEHNKEVFINDISREYSKYVTEIDQAVAVATVLEDGTIPQNPNSLIYLPLQVKDKIIGLISVQTYEKNAYEQYHLDILKTLASYTSAALYNARSYETLQNTLNELKITQQQLVHSEKMASLGELTAGIAHEIQNPLNFVNNFSDVNTELIDEAGEEIEKGNLRDVKTILSDLRTNEQKINHHGKRADAIVRGMLQHSRTSSGQKELTDINALCDEYLRLAYHGLRAKDKSFNATIETDFDSSIGKINVVSQDIGRVILNLINNAFYAASEKAKLRAAGLSAGQAGYEPLVTVSTKKLSDKAEIKVGDNGNGVPQKILDKIFQPFFTTKPTGQGTGLGLSLAYDIIKAHGGEIKVETKEGEGTSFIILLPLV